MIRYKVTSRIDTEELCAKQGEGFSFMEYSITNTGNLCMIFKKRLSENETRYIVKIHTRVGLHRQCSFTAVNAELVNAFLTRGEMYAYLSDDRRNASLARLEPDTKEDIVPIAEGRVSCYASKNREYLALGYEDGTIIRYEKGKGLVLEEAGAGPAYVTYDCNERLIWMDRKNNLVKRQMISRVEEYPMNLEGISSFMISRDDKNALVFKDGKVFILQRTPAGFLSPEVFDNLSGISCRMNKSTLAVFDGKNITVGTI